MSEQKSPKAPSGRNTQFFRAGSGAVIVNTAGQVLAFERSKQAGSWQFPQGGMEAGEEPHQTVAREILEETGIPMARLAQLSPDPLLLAYELPPPYRSAKTGRGQTQYWFLFRFKGTEAEIQPGEEFSGWRWMDFEDLVLQVVAFRRPLYQMLMQQFRPII